MCLPAAFLASFKIAYKDPRGLQAQRVWAESFYLETALQNIQPPNHLMTKK